MIERRINLDKYTSFLYRFVKGGGNVWVLQGKVTSEFDEIPEWEDVPWIVPTGFGPHGLRELAQLLEDTIAAQ